MSQTSSDNHVFHEVFAPGLTDEENKRGQKLLQLIAARTELEFERQVLVADRHEMERLHFKATPFLFDYITGDGFVDWLAFAEASMKAWKEEFEEDIAHINDWAWDGVSFIDNYKTGDVIKIVKMCHWISFYENRGDSIARGDNSLTNPYATKEKMSRFVAMAQSVTEKQLHPFPPRHIVEKYREECSKKRHLYNIYLLDSDIDWKQEMFKLPQGYEVEEIQNYWLGMPYPWGNGCKDGANVCKLRLMYREGVAQEKGHQLTVEALNSGRDPRQESEEIANRLRAEINIFLSGGEEEKAVNLRTLLKRILRST